MPRRPKKSEVALILKQGIPAGLQMMVISAGSAAIMSVVTSFGSDVVAGFGAANRLDSLLMLPAQALGTAVGNSMAGQNIAAKKWKRVKQITIYATFLNLGAMLSVATGIVYLCSKGIQMFISKMRGSPIRYTICQENAFFYPFLGFNFFGMGLSGPQERCSKCLSSTLFHFGYWYPLIFLFSKLLGEKGIRYFGMGISLVISSGFALAYYLFGKWRERELFQTS